MMQPPPVSPFEVEGMGDFGWPLDKVEAAVFGAVGLVSGAGGGGSFSGVGAVCVTLEVGGTNPIIDNCSSSEFGPP